MVQRLNCNRGLLTSACVLASTAVSGGALYVLHGVKAEALLRPMISNLLNKIEVGGYGGIAFQSYAELGQLSDAIPESVATVDHRLLSLRSDLYPVFVLLFSSLAPYLSTTRTINL
jgi:hypothetical protein